MLPATACVLITYLKHVLHVHAHTLYRQHNVCFQCLPLISLASFTLQDEKNQILTSNIWLNLVSRVSKKKSLKMFEICIAAGFSSASRKQFDDVIARLPWRHRILFALLTSGRCLSVVSLPSLIMYRREPVYAKHYNWHDTRPGLTTRWFINFRKPHTSFVVLETDN